MYSPSRWEKGQQQTYIETRRNSSTLSCDSNIDKMPLRRSALETGIYLCLGTWIPEIRFCSSKAFSSGGPKPSSGGDCSFLDGDSTFVRIGIWEDSSIFGCDWKLRARGIGEEVVRWGKREGFEMENLIREEDDARVWAEKKNMTETSERDTTGTDWVKRNCFAGREREREAIVLSYQVTVESVLSRELSVAGPRLFSLGCSFMSINIYKEIHGAHWREERRYPFG